MVCCRKIIQLLSKGCDVMLIWNDWLSGYNLIELSAPISGPSSVVTGAVHSYLNNNLNNHKNQPHQLSGRRLTRVEPLSSYYWLLDQTKAHLVYSPYRKSIWLNSKIITSLYIWSFRFLLRQLTRWRVHKFTYLTKWTSPLFWQTL